MTIVKVLLFMLADLLFFSNASLQGDVYETAIPVNERDVLITCPEGFIIDGTLTRCLRVATGYEDICEESKQCTEFLSAGAICQDGRCLCMDGYHYLHGECHKSKGLFEDCEKDVDCFVNAEYNAVTCTANICKCRDGFYQREYSTCRRKAIGVNDECLINTDCNEGAICINHNCSLSEGTNLKRTNRLEEVTSIESIISTIPPILVGNDCKDNKDCGTIPNSYCGTDKKCTCLRAHFASNKLTSCIPEIGEKCTDKDKLHVEHAVCKDEQWTCTVDYIASKSNQLCNEVSGYNNKCKTNELCQLLGPRAVCENKYCKCNSASHWLKSETFCWITKELEEECESDNDCVAIGDSLTPDCQKKGNKKFCSCPAKSHVGKSNGHKVCVADQTELGSYCAENSDCKVANSICQSNKCICQNNYFESNKSCLAGLNAFCKVNSDCKLNNTECFQGKDEKICQCANNFIATPERNCINKSAFNNTCNCNVQCSSVTANAICMINATLISQDNCGDSTVGSCRCIADDYYMDGACFKKKKLGQECTKHGECYERHKGENRTVCRNGICSCGFKYIRKDDYCVAVNNSNSIKISLWAVLLLAMLVYH